MRTIGQGGMAAVYQAKDLKQNTLCAIKEMSLSSVPTHEHAQAIQNFLAEATILSRLHHPNLPVFTDFFTEGSRHFLVMEYIEGYTLEDLLERNGGPFSERRVLKWAEQLCDVLDYLHSQQPPIIFRDLKPGNIMLRRDGCIKLIDFGIARIFRRSSTHDTQLLGTPGFAPPEQYGTAQTDERSDIYSLAMTLFQLMTNTLSEEGFGLLDVRSVNPAISSPVAHALGQATDPNPENRYESIVAFRRALFGVSTFTFEKGKPATTPEELAELCARYPEEAADYLFAGEIESWLDEIGAPDLAWATKYIRKTTGDPHVGVEKFLQVVLEPGSSTSSHSSGAGRAGTTLGRRPGRSHISRVGSQRTPLAPTVVVRPDKLDFGQVQPGISAPMLLHITGDNGTSVRGKIQPVEPWIIVNTLFFDGMSTLIRVCVDSTEVTCGQSEPTLLQGSIVVKPAAESSEYIVPVVFDVVGYAAVAGNGQSNGGRNGVSRPGRSLPLDEDEDEDDAPVSSGTIVAVRRTPTINRGVTRGLSQQNTKYSKYQAKYAISASGNGSASGVWDPVQVSAQQHLWLKRGLTFAAAFMAASFSYMLLAHLPPLAHASPLPPNQGFIAVLLGMIPLATLGASLVNRDSTRYQWDMINRCCTGMVVTLSALGLGELLWHVLLPVAVPPLQLCAMLLLAAVGATMGTNPTVSELLLEQGIWVRKGTWAYRGLRKYLRWLLSGAAVVVGGGLGFMMTMGMTSGWLTLFSILLAIGIMAALVMRVDYLVKYP